MQEDYWLLIVWFQKEVILCEKFSILTKFQEISNRNNQIEVHIDVFEDKYPQELWRYLSNWWEYHGMYVVYKMVDLVLQDNCEWSYLFQEEAL